MHNKQKALVKAKAIRIDKIPNEILNNLQKVHITDIDLAKFDVLPSSMSL